MITLLDQYEVEYKESYISGSHDQVVMGKMFYRVVDRGIKKYVYGSRGVAYGAINAQYASTPGTSIFDFNTSRSYRAQPYREKAGNTRATKHSCLEERIYDSMPPDALSCFKRNNANVFVIERTADEAPGYSAGTSGVDIFLNGFLMFDSYIPPYSGHRDNFNLGTDKYWTRSFPFEPRYADVKREKSQNFSNSVLANFKALFRHDSSQNFVALRTKRKVKGLILGTFAPARGVLKHDTANLLSSYLLPTPWKHRWVVDMDSTKKVFVGSAANLTSSCGDDDMMKVLYGFGDINTIFYTSSYTDSENSTGYAMLGTNNWPDFRINNNTNYAAPSGSYEWITGSVWSASPVIRGWKYGLYSGLPAYTSAYYRQGRYGQFRDMLEQRQFTKLLNKSTSQKSNLNNESLFSVEKSSIGTSPVTVKFLDADGNLVEPGRTQSQNLSEEVTSSLPFFDLTQRNRPENVRSLTNLKLLNFTVDQFRNTIL